MKLFVAEFQKSFTYLQEANVFANVFVNIKNRFKKIIILFTLLKGKINLRLRYVCRTENLVKSLK